MNVQYAAGSETTVGAMLAAKTNQLTDMATACCTLLDFFEGLGDENVDSFIRGWLIGLKTLDTLIEDELDVRMAGNDEMENGA